jgi:hypothetical protein
MTRCKAERSLLRQTDPVEDDVRASNRDCASLVQYNSCVLHEVEMVANNEACPEPATGLFVSGAEEDHIPLQRDALALQDQERHELDNPHSLHV